jgi:hypothetical protein
MRPDLLKWLGCGLIAALGLLAVTIAPREPGAFPSVPDEGNAGERTHAAAAVAAAVRAQP